MTTFKFQILGANSAAPIPGRFPSSFLLEYKHQLFLLDCGEGAQIKMKQFGVKRSRIDHVFISHLHGDHIFGLPGLLNSFNLDNRSRPLNIVGPTGLKAFINGTIRATGASFSYKINIHELTPNYFVDLGVIKELRVVAFPLQHRIPTFGYKFEETSETVNINKDAIEDYNLTISEIKQIKQGQPVYRDGQKIAIEKLTLDKRAMRSMAYCTDTIYDTSIIEHIKGVSLLYHEATYTHDLAEKARERMHSTAKEAALIGAEAEVQQLIIGHYSSRYINLEVLLDEAKLVFPNTDLALEGVVFNIL